MPTILDIILYEDSFKKIYFNPNEKNKTKNEKNNKKESKLVNNFDPTLAIDYPRTGFLNRFKIPVSQIIIKTNKLLLVPIIAGCCYSVLHKR